MHEDFHTLTRVIDDDGNEVLYLDDKLASNPAEWTVYFCDALHALAGITDPVRIVGITLTADQTEKLYPGGESLTWPGSLAVLMELIKPPPVDAPRPVTPSELHEEVTR